MISIIKSSNYTDYTNFWPLCDHFDYAATIAGFWLSSVLLGVTPMISTMKQFNNESMKQFNNETMKQFSHLTMKPFNNEAI
jgi:hydrogenase maturation factor